MSGLTIQKQQRENRAPFPFGPAEIESWLAGGARLAGALLLKPASRITDLPSSGVVLDFSAGAYCPLSVLRACQAEGLAGLELSDRKPALRWLREKGRAEHCLIGLTGVIGSGKSTLSALLAARGAVILDADLFARQALVKGSRGFERIHQRFGAAVLTAEGDLDRQALARLMFSDPQIKLEAEAIVHPLVREQYIRGLLEACGAPGRGRRLIVYEAPLLFEGRFERPELQKIIVVRADETLCIERAVKRGTLSADEVRRRLAVQMSQPERAARADIIVDNNQGQMELESAVASLYTQLMDGF